MSKYLIFTERVTDNGDGKELPSCLYPIKYLNESLPYDFLSNSAILSISTSLILFFYFYEKHFLHFLQYLPKGFSVHSLYNEKEKKFFFSVTGNFFDILSVFVSFLQTYYDI